MLVTIIFSFSHNVFKSLLSQGHCKLGLCGKEFNVASMKTVFSPFSTLILKAICIFAPIIKHEIICRRLYLQRPSTT